MADLNAHDDDKRTMTEIVREMGERNAPRRARVLLAIERLGQIAEAKERLALAEAKRRRFW